MSEYQPIETIPDDGGTYSTLIMLTDFTNCTKGYERRADAGFDWYTVHGWVDEDFENLKWTPTHWKPIEGTSDVRA